MISMQLSPKAQSSLDLTGTHRLVAILKMPFKTNLKSGSCHCTDANIRSSAKIQSCIPPERGAPTADGPRQRPLQATQKRKDRGTETVKNDCPGTALKDTITRYRPPQDRGKAAIYMLLGDCLRVHDQMYSCNKSTYT